MKPVVCYQRNGVSKSTVHNAPAESQLGHITKIIQQEGLKAWELARPKAGSREAYTLKMLLIKVQNYPNIPTF